MKWLSAGLTFVNLSTVFGLLLGMVGHGLTVTSAAASLILGGLAASAAYLTTYDPEKSNPRASASLANLNKASNAPAPAQQQAKPEVRLSKRGQRRLQQSQKSVPRQVAARPTRRYRKICLWLVGACFLIFAVRSFCWLIYIDGAELKVQSPYNLGDLSLHIAYIRNFASGVALWPDNPIYVFSKLRYPAGIDFFNALLCKVDVDLIQGLVWVGLLASLATFYALLRWGGTFGIAGFLFNGGIVGLQFLSTHKFTDYQGDKTIAWKSIPLTMFVTQRGLLYAIPAGLLLLWNWRKKYFHAAVAGGADPGSPDVQPAAVNVNGYGPLPFWVELSLYASMPLFHVHTFLALSVVLMFLFVFALFRESKLVVDFVREERIAGRSTLWPPLKWSPLLGKMQLSTHLVMLVGAALVPATFFLWLVTDHFNAGSVVGWQPGWVQAVKGDDLARSFIPFWFVNFGIWAPLVLTFVGLVGWRVWKTDIHWGEKLPDDVAFLVPAVAIFLLTFFVKLAPWGWDNLKVTIWAYFIILPFLWSGLVGQWPAPIRIVVCIALFGSGFVSLFGGLASGRPGHGFAKRPELNAVGHALRDLPVEARFAAFPIYNHPLLLQGRKLAMGYPGHLWTQGFADYAVTQNQLRELMMGAPNWREIAQRLSVRYIFWGREEDLNYPSSKKPWEKTAFLVKSDKSWGAIYDLEASAAPMPPK